MAQTSSIEWTDATWNPVTGCSKISPGCRNCYAERLAHRLKAMGQSRYRNEFKVTLQPDLLELPLRWRKPRTVFVNSMSDLFHEEVPAEFIRRVFCTMDSATRHTFQVLTKRSERLRQLAPGFPWPANVWMGVSVESPKYYGRIADLISVPASVRFLSIEPMLSDFPDIPLEHVDWVIVGGESGPHARPLSLDWIRSVRDQCVQAGVPFFLKQIGGTIKRRTGRALDGRTWDEMPSPRRYSRSR